MPTPVVMGIGARGGDAYLRLPWGAAWGHEQFRAREDLAALAGRGARGKAFASPPGSRGVKGPAALLLLALVALLAPGALAQAPEGPLYAYHTYASLASDLERLAAEHPGLARLASIGQSRAGLELWMLEVGNLSDPGLAAKPAMYLDAAHHGNEALSLEAAYLFAALLLEGYGSDAEARALVEGARLFVVPLVNPDGKAANTRQNAALVNLNRNYPFHWNERGTGPLGTPNYAGPAPASEPETQANIGAFVEASPLVYASLHAGSYDVVRPFGHAPEEGLPDEGLYANLLAFAEAQGLPSRWPSGSGESIDWAYGARGVFSVLLEVYEHPVRPPGTPQALPGPATREEVLRVLEPHFQVLRYLLANAGRWGALLEARFEEVEGQAAVLAVRNAGLAPARELSAAATGLELLAPLPAELGPGEEARVPVRLEPPAQVRLTYQRLAVEPEDPEATRASLSLLLELPAPRVEPRPTPAAGALAAVALALLLAARRRG